MGHLASIGLGKRVDHFVTFTADVPQCDRAHVLSVQAWSSFWDVRKYMGRKWDKCKLSGIPHRVGSGASCHWSRPVCRGLSRSSEMASFPSGGTIQVAVGVPRNEAPAHACRPVLAQ